MIGPEPPLAQKRFYCGDPWRVVVVSMCLVQTRSRTAQPTIAALLDCYPHAPYMAAAAVSQLVEAVRPLGLYNRRAPQLREVARRWPPPALTPSAEWVRSLPGCGEYVEQAYRLVVLEDGSFRPDDWALRRWYRWRWTRPVP